ncbi:MAG: TonB-dependent receptor, partial [Pseudomonadota bacterium]
LIGHPALAFFQQVVGLPLDFEFFNVESDPIESDSWALFGEGYFDLTDQLRLTVGLRHTQDEKSVRTRQQFLTFVDPAWITAEDDWNVTTGKVSLDYSVNDNSLLYGTLARGYKAGGLNPGGPQGGLLFEPEFINVIEVGSKNLFLNGRLRANVGAFYYDYEDLQIGQVSETSAVTVNADATVIGAEAELTYAATDAFLIDLGISLLDVELDEFQSADEGDPNAIAPTARPALDDNGVVRVTDSGNVIQNLEGNTLRNAPNSSLKLGLEYTFALGPDYDLTARADHFWQDKYFANEFNKPSDRIGSWSQTDAQLTLRKRDANWLLKLFSKNVFDSADVIRRGQDGPLVGRFRSVNVLEPRTVGLELQVSFD